MAQIDTSKLTAYSVLALSSDRLRVAKTTAYVVLEPPPETQQARYINIIQ